MASEELRCNSSKHDEHEAEQDHDVDHDRQTIQDGRDEWTHTWHRVDGSKWSQDSDNPDSRDVRLRESETDPAEHNDQKVQLQWKKS